MHDESHPKGLAADGGIGGFGRLPAGLAAGARGRGANRAGGA